jgi:hypothetical protein
VTKGDKLDSIDTNLASFEIISPILTSEANETDEVFKTT